MNTFATVSNITQMRFVSLYSAVDVVLRVQIACVWDSIEFGAPRDRHVGRTSRTLSEQGLRPEHTEAAYSSSQEERSHARRPAAYISRQG